MEHVVVWMDQKEARVFTVDGGKIDHRTVHAPGTHVHRHANEEDQRVRNHPDDERRYFERVAHALEGHDRVLLVGPAQTKLHFLRYAQQHHDGLEKRIVGIESADHPSDAQLVAHLRSYFGEPAARRAV